MKIMKLLPAFYTLHLKTQLSRSEFLILSILVGLLQTYRWVRLEELASKFSQKILFESRRRKIQRFLSRPKLTIANIIYERRAIPIYFELLPAVGACSFDQQKAALSQVLELLKSHKKVVLVDREFCSVDLAEWLKKQPLTDFCVRLKRSHYIQGQNLIWMQLKDVGLAPGVSLYFQGVKVTKSKGFMGGNIACKWKRKYQGKTAEEGWFILTSLKDLSAALKAYQRRFGIEEMFRDFKSGGYDIEGTYVDNERLISLIILVTLAYTSSIMSGQLIKQKGVSKYAVRPREPHSVSPPT